MFILSNITYSQQINFNACHSLLDGDDYVFEQINIVNGRAVFQTVADPAMGSRDCNGIGFCTLQILWSDGNNRWEIIADDGNGGFSNTFVLYYNTENSQPIPPGLTLGTWEEATTVTQSLCGTINTLEGSVLSTNQNTIDNQIIIHPNPVRDELFIDGLEPESNILVVVYDVLGKEVFYQKSAESIDVSNFKKGIYFLKLTLDEKALTKKVIIK